VLNRDGYRTFVPDQRGYSRGARPRGRWHYRGSRLAGDVEALVGRIGAGPVHLVGHDWGAAVAWAVAGRRPDLVRTLTTVSVPHPSAFLRSFLRSGQALRSWYMLLFQLPLLPELLGRLGLLDRALRQTGMTEEMVARVHDEMFRDGALSGGLGWYRAIWFADRRDVGRRVRVPVTHVWSDGDAALSRVGAELTARHVTGDYELRVLEGVSHWVPDEAPGQLAAIIEARAAREGVA
jgi:pimeloyl-ACP methyl ester carboxylesterase